MGAQPMTLTASLKGEKLAEPPVQTTRRPGSAARRHSASKTRVNALMGAALRPGRALLGQSPAAPPSARGSCAPSSMPPGWITTAPAWPIVSE
jgi:hypothetical protein